MEKADKKRIRAKILNLLDTKCDPCAHRKCESCPVSNELKRLNDLFPKKKDVQKKREPKITKPQPGKPKKTIERRDYFRCFDEGLTNAQTSDKLNKALDTVRHRRREWKRFNDRDTRMYDRVEMFKCFEMGWKSKEVSDYFVCSKATEWRIRKIWEQERAESNV